MGGEYKNDIIYLQNRNVNSRDEEEDEQEEDRNVDFLVVHRLNIQTEKCKQAK